MDQYSRGYNPNWYPHKYNQDNKNGNNSKINKNSYDIKSKSDYNYYNRPINSKSGYNNGNVNISRDSKDRAKYYEPESTTNQWNSSSTSINSSNRNSYYRPNQRYSNTIPNKKIESLTAEQSLPRSNSVPKLNSSTLGYFKTSNRMDINPHTRTYTSEKYYDEKPKDNFLSNNNSKITTDNSNKFDQEFPALGASKKNESKFSRPYSLNYSSAGSNSSNNNSAISNNTWSNSTSTSQSSNSNSGYKPYNSIVNNRLSTGNTNLNSSRPWNKKSNSLNYESSQQPQRSDSAASSPSETSSSTLSSIVSQSIKNNNLNNNNSNTYSSDISLNNTSVNGGSQNNSNTNSLTSTPTPMSSVNGGFAAAAAVSSNSNTNVESSNSELMKLRQLVPKVSSQSSRSKSNFSRVKVNSTRPLSTQTRRSATPVGLKVSLSNDVINNISSTKLHTSAPSSPKSSNTTATPILTTKHKSKSSSKFFKELRRGLSKSNQEDKNDNNSEISEKSNTAKENDKEKTDNSESSEKNNASTMDGNSDTISENNTLEEVENLKSNNEEIIITSESKDNKDNDNNGNGINKFKNSSVINIPNQESQNKIKTNREKYFAVPYSASLEREEQFMTSLGWDKQQYGYEDSEVEDGEWEITDEEKIKFYNIFNNDCKNIFNTLEPKTNKSNVTRKCLECSTCFACLFPCTICGTILYESGKLNNRMIQLHKNSRNNPSLLSQISNIDDCCTNSENDNSEVSINDRDSTKLLDKENEIKQHHHVCRFHKENHYKNEEN